jgi:formate/nitrite transporter FocA (FNT family)
MALPIVAGNREDDAHRAEQEEAHERSAPTGGVVYAAINQEGEDELARATTALGWSGLAAGLSMGFSFAVESLLATATPEARWQPLVSKLGYSVGFVIVVLGRQQLFTENTLTVMLPLLRRRDREVALNVARLWAVVFAANLCGAFAFAFVAGRTSVFPADVHETFSRIALQAASASFFTMLLRGIFAGWLIALMVWLLPYAETARFWVVMLLAYVIGIGHFPHVIAGSVDSFYLVATGQLSLGGAFYRFVVPTLVGNVIGGVSLVAALAHAQFVAGEEG